MRAKDRVTVAWCDPGQVDGAFAVSIARLARDRPQIGALMRVQGSGLLSRIRNELVRTYLEHSDDEWLWMLDSDHQVTAATFDKLTAAASYTTRPMVAGLYFAAYPKDGDLYPTPVPTIFRHDGVGYRPVLDFPTDQTIDIDAAGTGCILVHRRVLEALRDTADEGARDWAWFQDGPLGDGRWISEDLTFCTRVRAAGFPIACATGALLPHRKSYWLTVDHFEDWRASNEQQG